jgi:nitrile hydratase subunit beta
MNGIHDLGGMHGMGPIDPEPDEPVFHEEWQRRMFGMFIAAFAGGQFNVDEFRHAIERMGAAHYLESSYYEHWLAALETLLVEKGVLTEDELATRRAELAMEAA